MLVSFRGRSGNETSRMRDAMIVAWCSIHLTLASSPGPTQLFAACMQYVMKSWVGPWDKDSLVLSLAYM